MIIGIIVIALAAILVIFLLFELCVMLPRVAWTVKQGGKWLDIVGEYCNWLIVQGRYDGISTFDELIDYMHDFDWIYYRFWIRDFNKLFKDDRFKDILDWYDRRV